MSSKKIRLGMIGCGGNARWHMHQLLGFKDVQIVGLCDTAESSLEAAAKLAPKLARLPKFKSYTEMLEQVPMDAVEISTPHTTHYRQIMDSLAKGLHVLTEKPMVCKVKNAKDIIARVNKTGLVFGISYQRHFMAPYRYCREVIGRGELGKVNFVSCLQSQDWFRGCVLTGTWRGIQKWSGGGQLNDSGSHLLDIVLWMTDLQPAEVFALMDNLGSEVDILTAMSVHFDGGAMASFSVVGHAVNWLEDITIWCENGTLAIRGNEVTRWEAGKQAETVSPEALGRNWSPDENFVAAIQGKEEIQAPGLCGLRTIQLTEAAWESGATGQKVPVKR